ncbi:alkaline phosphatase D family protein [Pseudoalteromonas sp. SMS1]|uniref:alkaline phosphatase D family protein n=1 Tax=Pseudoalteromonas sp. SMS1 TaxID=2908894 RepID=UPI001F453FDA|nr:alkaline phosphatase D family protein [Pseudoalteromonas sp. SMS1]MCF2856426.1 alkaline phosphatase D family protein [Pseudoalteromonas sp. SMS1]
MMKYTKVALTTFAILSIASTAQAAPEVHYTQCQSVFSYQTASYQGTTNKNNNGNQWCYLQQAIDGSSWGNVRTETIPTFKTVTGKVCNTPSQYQGEHFYGCSTANHSAPWCYVDDQGNWEECANIESEPLPKHTHPQASQRLDRVALGSCFKTKGDMPQALAKLISHQPDLFLWLGDNIYADTTNMGTMRQKYDDKKRNIDYQKFLAANIPVMATWDDHDYGANNDGKHYPQRVNSQKEYLRHFDVPADDPRLHGQAGIYEAKMLGPANERTHVITLDARYFRSPTFDNYGTCEGSDTTILGTEQWQWLEKQLDTPSEIKLIASGIQVLPPLYQGRSKNKYCAYGDGKEFEQAIADMAESDMSGTSYESWAEVPLERAKLLRLVQKSINSGKTKAVIFLSGDQHWGELLKKEIPTSVQYGKAVTVYEVTASGFGQNWPYHIENPLRLPVYADKKGDGQYTQQCQFPFTYGVTTYRGCITKDHDQPWCYTQVDDNGRGVNGEWGNCAPNGARIPNGQVGTVSSNIANLTTSDRHLINKSGSNYGMVDIDWGKQTIKLSIQTTEEEAVSTIVNF